MYLMPAASLTFAAYEQYKQLLGVKWRMIGINVRFMHTEIPSS